MPKARAQTITAIHDQICTATLQWSSDWQRYGLATYVTRHGVAHLLVRGRTADAEQCLLELHFMAAFANSHETIVEPLMAWRLVGLDRARKGYVIAMQGLPALGVEAELLNAWRGWSLLRAAGLYSAAFPLAEWTLERRQLVLGAAHASTLESLSYLALLHKDQGRNDAAEPLYHRSLEASEQVSCADNPSTRKLLNQLAYLYYLEDRYAEAEPLFLRALDGQQRALGAEHSGTLSTLNDLSLLYKAQERYDEAESIICGC